MQMKQKWEIVSRRETKEEHDLIDLSNSDSVKLLFTDKPVLMLSNVTYQEEIK